MFNINFIDENLNQYDFAQFTITDEETPFEKLAYALMVLYDLIPFNKNWQTTLENHCSALFSNEGTLALVAMSDDGREFTVMTY